MPRRAESTIPFLREYTKRGKNLNYSKNLRKTQKPSGKGFVECKFCDKRIYSFDTSKLYYHILFEHNAGEWISRRDPTEPCVVCNLCGKNIPYFKVEDQTIFVLRLEDHIFQEHKLTDFYHNCLVDETTQVVEFICPNTKCMNKHKIGLGYAWCTEYHYKNNDVKLMCPHCLSFMLPKTEWERLK